MSTNNLLIHCFIIIVLVVVVAFILVFLPFSINNDLLVLILVSIEFMSCIYANELEGKTKKRKRGETTVENTYMNDL